MIGSLLYLTTSKSDIMFSVCLCARFQSCPKESHLIMIKHIIRYLKDTIGMGCVSEDQKILSDEFFRCRLYQL